MTLPESTGRGSSPAQPESGPFEVPAASVVTGPGTPRLLIVDRDPAARQRLRTQLRALHRRFPVEIVAEADSARSVRDLLAADTAEQTAAGTLTTPMHATAQTDLPAARLAKAFIILLDVLLADTSGVALAAELQAQLAPPQIILIGPSEDALHDAQSLDLAATLRRPVRADMLESALRAAVARQTTAAQTAARALACETTFATTSATAAIPTATFLPIVPQGGRQAVVVDDILYLRAELKYVLIRTRDAEYLTEQPLTQLLDDHPTLFIQPHRAALVARHAIAGARRVAAGERDPSADAYWELLLHGTAERIPVSRRRWRDIRTIVAALSLDLQ